MRKLNFNANIFVLGSGACLDDLPQSQEDAKKVGSPHYVGEACPHGHIIRATASKKCALCVRNRAREAGRQQPTDNPQTLRMRSDLSASKKLYGLRLEIDHLRDAKEEDYWDSLDI